MRVMLNNDEGCNEVRKVDNVSVCLNGTSLCLSWNDSDDIILVDMDSNFAAHAALNDLLSDGYVNLKKYPSDYKPGWKGR